MKILRVSSVYPDYLKSFYTKNQNIRNKTYKEQSDLLDYNGYPGAEYLKTDLANLDVEIWTVYQNIDSIQNAWFKEHFPTKDIPKILDLIVIAQAQKFKPDILWYDYFDTNLLKMIIEQVPSIKLKLGWVGSAIPKTDCWQYLDLVLSCAPESVAHLTSIGIPAKHFNHGFDPKINNWLKNNETILDLIFIGQLIRGKDFHLYREQLIENLTNEFNLKLYSSKNNILKELSLYGLKTLFFHLKSKTKLEIFNQLPVFKNISNKPINPINFKLRPYIESPIFGLDMYQKIKDAKICLNIHADSSPLYASNMRLFEITGVGTCLLTDWKQDINKLFIEDKEIVTYKTKDDCIKKVKWLLDHPKEREQIALAGQKKCLKDHSFEQRAKKLIEIINDELKNKCQK